MLDLAATRLLVRTDHLYAEQEDDRLAGAVARILNRPDLTAEASVRWPDAIEADFAAIGRGSTPAYASNAMRTLRMLYVLADLGISQTRGGPVRPVTHRVAVKARLAEVLALVFKHN
jgi:hypothetical protein